MITVTEKAVTEIQRIMKDQGLQAGTALRLGVTAAAAAASRT